MHFLKFTKKFMLIAAATSMSLSLSSCEDFFDYEGDCTPVHKIRFIYDRNLKWANAFGSEVNSINLYVFDKEGIFVKEYAVRGKELAEDNYLLTLDLPMGEPYTFVAWCGLDNIGAETQSFTVPHLTSGVSSLEDLKCQLNTSPTPPPSKETTRGEAAEYSFDRLNPLFHGMLENQVLEDNHDGTEYIHTISLTKDTNHIRIMLQEIDDDGITDPDQFSVSIDDANGLLAYNNSLLGNIIVQYSPWAKYTDILGVVGVDQTQGSATQVPGLIADLTTSRLMASSQNTTMLTVWNNEDNKLVAQVPVIQYGLAEKPYYENYRREQLRAQGDPAWETYTMTDQEFLDRQDEYVMTFFLQGGKWIYTVIEIESWRIVIHNYGLS